MPQHPFPEPYNALDSFKGHLKMLGFTLPLGGLLIAINFTQMASLGIKPFSQKIFRRHNRNMADFWWGWCAKAAEEINGTSVRITGDKIPDNENVVIICNHQAMTDIPVLLSLARRHDRLGDLKWYVKHAVKYVPGIGWGMQFLDCIFIKRNWTEDEMVIKRAFAHFRKHRFPFWIINFAEGTRLRTHKLEASQKYAEKQNLEPLQHLLMPRSKGFAATVTELRDMIDAVYDCTIGYPDGVPSLGQYIKGYVPIVHIHVERFPVSQLPTGPDALAAWLYKRFQIKDNLLDYFYQNLSFTPPKNH